MYIVNDVSKTKWEPGGPIPLHLNIDFNRKPCFHLTILFNNFDRKHSPFLCEIRIKSGPEIPRAFRKGSNWVVHLRFKKIRLRITRRTSTAIAPIMKGV